MPPRISPPRCLRCRHQLQLQRQTRLFTTTKSALVQPKTNPSSLLPPNTAPPPPYPYGRSYFYKQRNHGLYGGAMIQFGNNVSERTEIKTRRRWHPNILVKNIYSRALGRTVRVKVNSRVLRTIDKVGGLDEYLLGTSAARVRELGEEGWKLRWAVLNAPSMKKTIAKSPTIRGLQQGWLEKLQTLSTKARVQKKKVSSVERVEEVVSELDVEALMKNRLRERSHMSEEAVPMTIWQRVRRAVSRPFDRN